MQNQSITGRLERSKPDLHLCYGTQVLTRAPSNSHVFTCILSCVQNLTLALVAVVFATLPTVAGIFPLWLAVTLHEGSTLLVARNSLRLLLDPNTESFSGV